MSRTSNPYREYVFSKEFARRKRERIKAADSCCERCGNVQSAQYLTLHHLTYERLGNERDEDLQLLCRDCHREADRERQRAHPLFEKRLAAWALKRWGPGWEFRLKHRPSLEEKYFQSKESSQRW